MGGSNVDVFPTPMSGASTPPKITTSTVTADQMRSMNPQTMMQTPESISSVASELETMFTHNFSNERIGVSMNTYQHALSDIDRRLRDGQLQAARRPFENRTPDCRGLMMSYDATIPLLTQELVEMVSVKFGRLGCHHLGDSDAQFYVESLAFDATPSMFEPSTPGADPLSEFDDHRTLQMIDVWFSMHPLSTIISKTLLLREYRSGTHDEILLATILADATYVHDVNEANPQSDRLFRYAAARLFSRPVHSCSLSTAQALVLLGWHELCLGRARRATCFLGYACRIVSKLVASIAEAPTTGLSRINGIDVGKVEAELMGNVYWITFSITLWSFMQFDQSFADLLPLNLPVDFPPVDEGSSSVAQLDIVSDNVSTLQAQAKMIRQMWPLSHVASTLGHIYALFPQNARSHDADPLAWQARPVHQLRQLFTPHQDIAVLCVRIRAILADAADALKGQSGVLSSRAYILMAYHTLLIHLLFPRAAGGRNEESITNETLVTFITSARALLDIFSQVESQIDSNPMLPERGSSVITNILTLALDAAGRAMDHFHTKAEQGYSAEQHLLSSRRPDLLHLATDLQSLSKSEKLSSARRLRIVKKKLKQNRSLFEQLNPNQSPRPPSFSDSTSTSSQVDSTLCTPRSAHDFPEHASSGFDCVDLSGPTISSTLLSSADLPPLEHDPLTLMPSDFSLTSLTPGHDALYAPLGGGCGDDPLGGSTTMDKDMAEFTRVNDLDQLRRDLGIPFSFS
ncbi:MAG: hypothetical protein M1833_001588 [Piccolia ochrophora]|nr:MAG: hypothetical protein M1833_001588 [Piccolia ochrophora]